MKILFALALTLAAQAGAANPHAPAASRMSGWEAFSQLQNGNMRFYEGHPQHPHQEIALRDELAAGQHPHSIVVSCSDSRLPPELIFDQGLGDIFPVRIAGNLATTEAIASIEYAVSHLGPKLLLVMGHESCGAVGAAVAAKLGVSNGSPSLDTLVNKIRGNLSAGAVASAAGDKALRNPVKENVTATMKELLQRSEIVRDAVATKGLILAQGVYSLRTGRVEFWDVGAKIDGMPKVADAPAMDAPAIREASVHSEDIRAAPAKKKAKAH